MIFAAALLLQATPAPAEVRRCGDMCQFAAENMSALPVITSKATDHPEKNFDGYIACLKAGIERAALSPRSSDDALDGAQQAAYDACSKEREAANLAFFNTVMSTKPGNPPAEVRRFSEICREAIITTDLLPFLSEKIGKERVAKYLAGLRQLFPDFLPSPI